METPHQPLHAGMSGRAREPGRGHTHACLTMRPRMHACRIVAGVWYRWSHGDLLSARGHVLDSEVEAMLDSEVEAICSRGKSKPYARYGGRSHARPQVPNGKLHSPNDLPSLLDHHHHHLPHAGACSTERHRTWVQQDRWALGRYTGGTRCARTARACAMCATSCRAPASCMMRHMPALCAHT